MRYVVGLPLMDGRYSVQWRDWIEKFIKENELEGEVQFVQFVHGGGNYDISHGEFLSFAEYYKVAAQEIAYILEHYKDGDSVLLLDGELPGAEVFEFERKMSGKWIDIDAVWEAGKHDKTDLVALRGVESEDFERGWFRMTRRIFVGSESHKKKIVGAYPELDLGSKIVVSGLPIDFNSVLFGEKVDNIVHSIVYGGRLSNDKGYDVIKKLRANGFDIYCTKEHNLSKAEYYGVLSSAGVVVVPSRHENFGIVPIEALGMFGVPVVVSDLPVFKETVGEKFIYHNMEELKSMLLFPPSVKNEDIDNLIKKYNYEEVLKKWLL